jgi:integrase
VEWANAGREHVRDLVVFMRQAAPVRRGGPVAATGGVDLEAGRAGYAPRTINHQLAVLSGFYDFAIETGTGPLVNPVPAPGRRSRMLMEHRRPLEPWPLTRRASYRQRVPRQTPRSLPDMAVDALFEGLGSNRDRALVAFWLSSGIRAGELLGLTHDRVDYGRRVITVVSKGTRALEEVPASADAFVWLALYIAEGFAGEAGGPVWWTLREPRRPLTYHAARAVLVRVQRGLGTRYRLHDLRHTAAVRMAADPGFSLVDVQTVLRHAHVSTTQLYLRPRVEDLVEQMAAMQQRRAEAVTDGLVVAAGHDPAAVAELLGLGR